MNFTIFGPIDADEYWNKCQEAISKLPSNILVKYEGSVPHYNLPQKLSNQHLLLLPTQNENYGHVIMEAWQNGCPVLISDQTPWKNLEEKFIGGEFPISETGSFTSVLEQISSYSQEQFDHLSKSSYDFALKFLENPELVSSNKKIIE